jgi:serine/threonine protein kinase
MMEEEVALSCKIDIFALGILFHQYMSGSLPGFDTSTYDYVAEAILDGAEVTLSPDIPEEFADIIYKMLLPNPAERISAKEVYDMIQIEELPEIRFGKVRGKSTLPQGRKLPEGSKLKIYMGNKK